jgi:hypothetical protein
MSGALHRAIAASRQHNAEVLVFFEVPWERFAHVQATDVLTQHLCLLWGVDESDLTIYNVVREHEHMRDWALGDVSTGDKRLFESGKCFGSVTYHDTALLLVCPPTLCRLLEAQRALPIVDGTAPMPLDEAPAVTPSSVSREVPRAAHTYYAANGARV